MKIIVFILGMIISSNVFGQDKQCNKAILYEFLLSKELISEGDQGHIMCSPVIKEKDGDGVYIFGTDEIDSFSFFFILQKGSIHFVNSESIDSVFYDVSRFLSSSKLTTAEKLKGYTSLLEILKSKTRSNPWSLPKED